MNQNLIETVRFCFTNRVITQLGAAVDEASPAVTKTLEKAIPLILNALLIQAGQGGEPANLLLLAREADSANALSQLANIEKNPWYEQGSNLLLDLLGDTYRNTVNHLAASVGIRPAAAGTLLQVAATAVMGVLGQHVVSNQLTASEFIGWLQAQKSEIAAAMLPSIAPAEVVELKQRVARAVPTLPSTPVRPIPQLVLPQQDAQQPASAAMTPPTRGLGQVWQWGLLLLVVAGLSYYVGRDRHTQTTSPSAEEKAKTTSSIPEVAGRYDQDKDTYIYDTGVPTTLTLSDGSVQHVGANSTENRLFNFLSRPSIQVDSVNRTKGWINFDQVNFEANSTALTAGSEQQLRNIAAILKTFPKAVVKIGGYTDSTGVALHNLQLSEARAKAAMLALATMGVNADRLQFKGYGAKYYVSSNNTPTGRALNRRISVRVVKK
jgi:OOP family OmpA-OmpF porin